MAPVNIQTFRRVIPMIYAYNTPTVREHNGWTKIGYTEKQTVEERIAQQTHVADIPYAIAWKRNAMYNDGSGEYFNDHDFHAYLEREANIERKPRTEWFRIDGATSKQYFQAFADRDTFLPSFEQLEYQLRQEQQDAVAKTKAYFEKGGAEFLWNAKPRFGKTLTSYDLIRQMGFQNVLIVTNRPAIANSWAEDFRKFIGWRNELCFVSETDALKGKAGVLSREDYANVVRAKDEDAPGMVAFESLQSLKGSLYFGGKFDKLKWMAKDKGGIAFDLLIIDESQEGVDTYKTDKAFRNINYKHLLYLSGTPFKQLAKGDLREEQIFNWSYADEQERKDNWGLDSGYNPYEALPRLSMFTYQLSNMIFDQIQKGLDMSGEDEAAEYAFDLNEFFATDEKGKFLHEHEIRKFLHSMTTLEKYPFSTPELRNELKHTLWMLNRVDSCKALYRLLKEEGSPFADYEVVLAAGDGNLDENDIAGNDKAFDRVIKAIAENEKTITLSVGQLTVGVTIPEWSGVLMLCNLKSPSGYMQAAFRAQNPCSFTDAAGKRYRKETAYVFDFDPARTLIIFDEFANNLKPVTAAGQGTSDDRAENIRRLLNFFPVLGEDDEGRMVELNAAQVLSIPRKLKSQEVVRHGFISNFLFQNIGNVFGASAAVRSIIEKLVPAQEEKTKKNNTDALGHMDDVSLDEDGNAEVPDGIIIGTAQGIFGEKIYEDLGAALEPALRVITNSPADKMEQSAKKLADSLKEQLLKKVVAPTVEHYDVKKGEQSRIERDISRKVDDSVSHAQDNYLQRTRIAQADLQRKQQSAQTEEQLQAAKNEYNLDMASALQSFTTEVQSVAADLVQNTPTEVVARIEQNKAEQEKKTIEDEVRAHLRGFARTIPSFIMAYGKDNLTLANFDDYTEDDVFEEVTGITEDEFRFLRDGGKYIDPNTGEEEWFDGKLFDEVVFNDSIREFLNKRMELANYFDESHDEDIFDYIPPQKTNQIFTPKWVVKKMVDELEENNPGCFDDPTKTFADLYMKSGLYITEIVKRLFRSEKMKQAIPDDAERIRHILRKQVYGMAPTRIIYLIATNYILGFDESLKAETTHFVQADAAQAAKNDSLADLANRHFG